MKFSIQTNTIKNILQTIVKIGGKEVGDVVQDAVQIFVENSYVFFQSNQIDFNVQYKKKISKSEDGEVVLNAQIVSGIIDNVVDGSVDVEKKDSSVFVKSNTSSSEIKIISKDDVLHKNTIKEKKKNFSIEREVFIEGLKSVQHAAAVSIIKPELASVFVYKEDKTLYFAATDSFRLAETRFQIETDEEDFSALIPAKNTNKILRVLESDISQQIHISVDDQHITIFSDDFVLQTYVIEGSFPAYKNIIPKEFNIEFVVLKSDIQNFLKQSRFFSDKLNSTFFSLDKDSLEVSFKNKEVGNTKNIINIANKKGDGEIPVFNHKFITDALQTIKDEKVQFRFADQGPMMVRGASNTIFFEIISPQLISE